ncbi:MAG: hypothetical protein LBJ24_02935 [Treponema sp.]|jgi:hypothetical protein|nr:hypothetical protein [Treponema sp.]
MSTYTSWMPGSRDGQLAMADNWVVYLTAARRTAWGIPQDQYNELADLTDAARAILQKAKDDTQRTPVVTVQCQAAFKALKKKLRFFKKHYFLVPPLENADLAALGLDIPGSRSDIPAPESEPEADLGFPDYHLIDVFNIRRRGPLKGDPRSEWGVRIHVGILDGTGPWRVTAPPATCPGPCLPAAAGSALTSTAIPARPCTSVCATKTARASRVPSARLSARLFHEGGFFARLVVSRLLTKNGPSLRLITWREVPV